METHSSTLAWEIPWTEEPGGLQSMSRKESDMTEWLHFHFSLACIGEGNGNPLQCSCLENPRDGGARWATVYGVTESWTWLMRLSSSSSSGSLPPLWACVGIVFWTSCACGVMCPALSSEWRAEVLLLPSEFGHFIAGVRSPEWSLCLWQGDLCQREGPPLAPVYLNVWAERSPFPWPAGLWWSWSWARKFFFCFETLCIWICLCYCSLT